MIGVEKLSKWTKLMTLLYYFRFKVLLDERLVTPFSKLNFLGGILAVELDFENSCCRMFGKSKNV